MDTLESRKFELHAGTDEYAHRIEQATEWVEYFFDKFEKPCLSYSGGKDSLVLLHLITQQCGYDDIDVYHFDNGLLKVPGSDDFVRESVSKIGGNLFYRTSEKANSDDMVLEEGHGYRGFWGNYSTLSERQNWDLRLLGIRAEESNDRRDRYGQPPINRDEQYTSAAPIHHLKTEDIWAYIVDNDLDYHEIYDKQGELYGDMAHIGNRLVTIYDSEFENLGNLEVSQFLYPSETNHLKEIEQKHQ